MLAIPLRMFKCSLKLTNCNLNLYDGYLKLFWLIIIIIIITIIIILCFYIALYLSMRYHPKRWSY